MLFRRFFSHFFILTISTTTLTIWLFFAGVLSGYFQYFLGALLVLVIFVGALTSKPPEIRAQDESIDTLRR
jgi:uncharacterized membrane protein YfcA